MQIDPGRIIFEAPRKPQQVWFVKHFGPNVNLGNMPPEDVISVETIRQGLRADTLLFDHDGRTSPSPARAAHGKRAGSRSSLTSSAPSAPPPTRSIGARREVVLVGRVEDAFALRRRWPDALVMGEVDGRRVAGFDFGNSTSAIARADLRGRRLIQRTSAGTQGVVAAERRRRDRARQLRLRGRDRAPRRAPARPPSCRWSPWGCAASGRPPRTRRAPICSRRACDGQPLDEAALLARPRVRRCRASASRRTRRTSRAPTCALLSQAGRLRLRDAGRAARRAAGRAPRHPPMVG